MFRAVLNVCFRTDSFCHGALKLDLSTWFPKIFEHLIINIFNINQYEESKDFAYFLKIPEYCVLKGSFSELCESFDKCLYPYNLYIYLF